MIAFSTSQGLYQLFGYAFWPSQHLSSVKAHNGIYPEGLASLVHLVDVTALSPMFQK
jgi:hypothetical protein